MILTTHSDLSHRWYMVSMDGNNRSWFPSLTLLKNYPHINCLLVKSTFIWYIVTSLSMRNTNVFLMIGETLQTYPTSTRHFAWHNENTWFPKHFNCLRCARHDRTYTHKNLGLGLDSKLLQKKERLKLCTARAFYQELASWCNECKSISMIKLILWCTRECHITSFSPRFASLTVFRPWVCFYVVPNWKYLH